MQVHPELECVLDKAVKIDVSAYLKEAELATITSKDETDL